jgi:lambda family phage portal protein
LGALLDSHGKPFPKSYANRILASGFSNAAASLTKPVFKGWNWQGADPDSDIIQHLPIIRQRSRQLSMEAPVIAGLYRTLTTNVIGDGLRPEPTPDAEYLGMTADGVKKFKDQVLRLWETFAESPNCDCYRRDNFYELTRLAFRAQLESGDCFVTMPRFERRNAQFLLKIQLVEADCVDTPQGPERIEHEKLGNDVLSGVEISEWGHVVGYWFYTGPHKNATYRRSWHVHTASRPRWIYIPAFGAETGQPNVLHLMETIRPGQRRGIPIIAPTIELALTLDRYMKAEAVAAQVQALFTVLIKSLNPEAAAGEMSSMEGEKGEQVTEGNDSLVALGNGIIQYLRPGEDAVAFNPSRPTTSFEPFINSVIQQMGPPAGMPYEMMVQKFQASYSASMGAMNMARGDLRVKRSGIIVDFCDPVFMAMMDEAVARGWIYAPGYFENPLARRAYTRVKWNGPGLPQMDFAKEVGAWEKAVSLGFATASQATSELNGGDYMENLSVRSREIEAAKAAGLSPAAATGMTSSAGAAQLAEQSANQGGMNAQVL